MVDIPTDCEDEVTKLYEDLRFDADTQKFILEACLLMAKRIDKLTHLVLNQPVDVPVELADPEDNVFCPHCSDHFPPEASMECTACKSPMCIDCCTVSETDDEQYFCPSCQRILEKASNDGQEDGEEPQSPVATEAEPDF